MTQVLIPRGWDLSTLGEHIQKVEKRNPQLKPETEFNYVEIGSINSEGKRIESYSKVLGKNASSRTRNVIRTNDIIYATTRPYYRNVALVPAELNNQICSTGFCVLRVKDPNLLDPKFLFYYLQSDHANNQILKSLRGVSYPAVTNRDIFNISIPIAGIEKQKAIAKKLDHVLTELKRTKKEVLQLQKKKISSIFILSECLYSNITNRYYTSEEVLSTSRLMKTQDVCLINPSKSEIKDLSDDVKVSFVPMRSVDDKEGVIKKPEIRTLGEVRNGYTYFRDKDIIFAKITPCMENGKSAIALKLENGIGFGSTEFHVLRTRNFVLPKWIYYFIRQIKFRKDAAMNFKGTAGQQRVPVSFIESYIIPIPPLDIQYKVLSKLDRSISRIGSVELQLNPIVKSQEKIKEDLYTLESLILDKAFTDKLIQ